MHGNKLPNGENLLVCVDYYSRFVEVVEMNDTSAKATIDEFVVASPLGKSAEPS